MLTKEDLKRKVRDGAVSDIFRAERAYGLLREIGTNAGAINASRGFGELFGVFQALAQSEVLLALARLYDRPNPRYPVRCLQGLLKELEAHAEELPEIVEKPNLFKELRTMGMPGETVAELDGRPDPEITRAIVKLQLERLEEPTIVQAVDRVKNIRDKVVAHNEDVQGVQGPTWSAVVMLLKVAKDFVGLIGWAYLSTVYTHDGTYTLSSDANRPARAMRRLLQELGIAPEPKRHA